MKNILTEGIKKNSLEAFETVFRTYYAELVIYAENYLSDRAASEDLVQDFFVYIWENPSKIDIKTSMKGYLYAAIKNLCLNYLKALKLTDSLDIIEVNIMLETETEVPVEIDPKRLKIIREITDSMPAKMKEIFELKVVQNYSYQEIASSLNISLNTVKTQLKRAKSKIGQYISFVPFCILSFLK